MQPGNLVDERSIAWHGTNTVKQTAFFLLELTQHAIDRIQVWEGETLVMVLRGHVDFADMRLAAWLCASQ